MTKRQDIDAIERDLEATRSRTEGTIQALQDRLQPRAVLDEATRFFQGTDSGEYAERVTRSALAQARENPIPLALMGIGAALLATKRPGRPVYIEDGATRFYDANTGTEGNYEGYVPEEHYAAQENELDALYDDEWEDTHRVLGSYETIDRTYTRLDNEKDDEFQTRIYEARGKAFGIDRKDHDDDTSFRERIDARVNAAKTKSAEYKDRASNFRRRQTERASSLADRAGAAAHRAGDRSREAFHDARDGAAHLAADSRDAARRGVRKSGELYEQNPLVGAALAIAAGAITGALFDTTRQERRALGGVADDINDGVKQLNQRANEKVAEYANRVKSAAEDAGDRVEDVADDIGGTTNPDAKPQTGAVKTS